MTKNRSKEALRSKSISVSYEIGEELGEGGNAKVFISIMKSTGEPVAIKMLKNRDFEKEERFKNEVMVMYEYASLIKGILPVLDKNIENCWYVMPVAQSCMEAIRKETEIQRLTFSIDGVIQLSETLEMLHAKGIHHRDIKPDNIYYFNNRFYFGDFGLVEFPDSENNLTRNDRGLGAIFTIAPEMKRNPKDADGAKADVYSLAKTLWMLLTLDEKGFDGQYNYMDDSHRLHAYKHLSKSYLVEIERILQVSTDNTPGARPSIKVFKESLLTWRQSIGNSNICARNEWDFLVERIFGQRKPESSKFTNLNDIIDVLNTIGKSPALNHMLFDNGGGLDFTKAMIANEPDFIYIVNEPFWSLLKPKALYFESFNDCRWNYFFLEAEDVAPIFADKSVYEENLVEDTPGHYVPATYVEYGVYDYDKGNKYPDGYKHVYRYTKGKFLIVLKTCTYNHMPRTYDGRHGMMSNVELRSYIEHLQNTVHKYVEMGYEEEAVLQDSQLNKHPYPDRMEDIIWDVNNNLQLPHGNEFVKSHFKEWDFKDVLSKQEQSKGNLKFRFEFEIMEPMSLTFLSSFYYLATDGRIKRSEEFVLLDTFFVYDREQAIRIKEELTKKLNSLCNGFDIDSLFHHIGFNIKWEKEGSPIHLFTEAEIEQEMRSADDRICNKLVIDEYGFAHVIPAESDIYLYPVIHETWGAFKLYVGKYSNLYTLKQSYIDSLICWLEYLKTGCYQYCDENKYCDKESVIQEILTYYDKGE